MAFVPNGTGQRVWNFGFNSHPVFQMIERRLVEQWARRQAEDSFNTRVRGFRGTVWHGWKVAFTVDAWMAFVEPMLEEMPLPAREYFEEFLLKRLEK